MEKWKKKQTHFLRCVATMVLAVLFCSMFTAQVQAETLKDEKTGVTQEYTLKDEETGVTWEYTLGDDNATITGCSNASGEVLIPEKVEEYNVIAIGSGAFNNCKQLESVTIPEGVTTISSDAFINCASLQKIVIPASVNSIGVYDDEQEPAFLGCPKLKIQVADGNVSYSSDKDGVLYNKEKTVLIAALSQTGSYTVSEGVKIIAKAAFNGNSSLESVVLPNSVKTIEEAAFNICTGLKSIILPYGLETIGERAFNGCKKLESIVIPSTVTKIESSAFDDCTGLTEFYYPMGLDIYYPEESDIPVVSDEVLKSDIPVVSDEVLKIAYTYTQNADNTVSLTIKRIFYVEKKASSGENGNYKAEDLDEAVSLVLPASIDGMTISDFTLDEEIDTEKVSVFWKKDAPNMPETTMSVIYATVGNIPLNENWVWQDSDKNETLKVGIPSKATAVYNGEDKEKYKNVTVSITITRTACTHSWDGGKVTKEATATEKGEKTYTCAICKETRTESIEPTGQQETVKLPEKGADITDTESKAQYKVTKSDQTGVTVQYVKSTNKNAKTITIPATISVEGVTCKVTSIGAKAFKNNKKITKVVIGSNIESIGTDAFYGCNKLKTANIGKNVTTIGNRAFYKCIALTKITIPSKVNKIGKQAFYGCKKLKSITIKTTKLTTKNVGSKVFAGTPKNVTVKVPKKKLSAYKKLLKSKGISSKAKIKK